MADLIDIQTADGTAEAYLAQPEGESKGGVLFFMDAIGLRPRIAEMAERIASWGYTVLAPNVFYRDGDMNHFMPKADLRIAEERQKFFETSGIMQAMQNLTPDRAAVDTEAYVAELEKHVGADAKLAATGYCMGARLSIRAGGQFPDKIVAVGGFHGGNLVTDDADSPHTKINGQIEYVFGHADNDGSMPPEKAAALDEALEAAGAKYQSAIYPDAPHGYSMSDTSMWHEPSAERHFTELKALLERTVG